MLSDALGSEDIGVNVYGSESVGNLIIGNRMKGKFEDTGTGTISLGNVFG